MSQNPFDPSQQQPQPTSYPPQGYQPPGYQQPSYQQPGYQQQGYQPQYQPLYSPPQKQQKSPILGYVSLGLAVLGSLLFAWPMMAINLSELAKVGETGNSAAISSTLNGQIMLMLIGGLLVFVAFVLSIISIAMNAGRVWAIVALVSTVILPWVLFMIFMGLNPTLSAFVR